VKENSFALRRQTIWHLQTRSIHHCQTFGPIEARNP